ncbi:Phosphatidylglycerol/phosphatidylinositol transfer protein [Entomophthora muscae]|uniref:Phosphatidylglycerol/phosphatidylinositol transfer protein n=1 Tax=Entomophthora muscae TaxID=34485 RepID=A0ACC2S4H7_9FUNG|nr:Phosphatidylglycerol/phosphatidylinositol transfer protein [Entomophthora muscae]
MQLNIVSAIFFSVAASAAEYSRPAQTYTEPAAPRVYANGMIIDNGSPSDVFQISDIILTPAVPVAGQPLDVHLIGKLKKVIDQGSKTTIKANYDGAEVMNIDLDVCELAKDRKFKHQCPAQPEDFDIHHTLKIPGSSPKGNYAINAFGFNQNNERIFNVSIIHNSQQGYKRA